MEKKIINLNGVQTYSTRTGKPYKYSVSQNDIGRNYTTTIYQKKENEINIINKLNTYEIQGVAFLDSVGGNNQYDNNEKLANIQVTLYDKEGNQIAITLTDANGEYKFINLSPDKQYKLKFTYNGLLYENVTYNASGDKTSKIQENTQTRNNLNNKFKEIGSYPNNYETTDYNTGNTIKNKVFLAEEVTDLFKEVSKTIVEKGRK